MSRYFDNGIGSRQEKGDLKLPHLRRRESANVSEVYKDQGRPYQRERFSTVGNDVEEVEPITLFNSNIKKNSPSVVKRKDKSQLPLKYSKFEPVNEQMRSIEEE